MTQEGIRKIVDRYTKLGMVYSKIKPKFKADSILGEWLIIRVFIEGITENNDLTTHCDTRS